MSKKFSDFTNSNLNEFSKNNASAIDNFKRQNTNDYNHFHSLINKYSNMSNDGIFNEFLKVAHEKKQNGTLTLDYINNIKNTIFPLISAEQQQVFNDLVNFIR